MKKVLIYYPKNVLGMSDFRPADYQNLHKRVKAELDNNFPNFGNKVWLQAILSEISDGTCEYEFGYDDISEDYINQKFDCVLMPLANCFHAGWIKYMEKRASHIEKLKIPVYVIACGVQANSYDDLDNLVNEVKIPATRLISAVYNTGGQFALRGYFTAEFFEKLGFKNAVVTGCPSIFQMGRELTISNKKVSKDEFSATINGTFNLPVSDNDIKISDYICQDICAKYMYDPEFFTNNPMDTRRIFKLVKRGEYPFLRALANNKIKVFADVPQWLNYYIYNNVNFSFGSRIHGTIIPILAGVPSFCYSRDARTREMVEFFDIPYVTSFEHDYTKKRNLYDWYCETDYTKFNTKFKERYDNFEAFLKKCGLIENINQQNTFMQRDADSFKNPPNLNEAEINRIRKKLSLYALPIRFLSK